MERLLHSRLTTEQSKRMGLQLQDGRQAAVFTNAFLKNSVPSLSQDALNQFMERKAVVLDYSRKKKEKKKMKRAKGLNAKQRRELKVFQLKPEHQRYELFLPLHELWKQYVRDLCNGLKPDSNPQIIQQKLLKADFHGAVITVVKSKCPSYVGTTGILVQEMKHIFKVITKDDKLKVIPKRNSVFGVEIDGFVTHIYGSKFQLRSSERSAKKFKAKGTIDL
ncbi:hypothetical protein AGOR_G00002170 [Albula goreensis]|uniref:Ribonuclease P protein subunit p29 n=1 Tax=Albula goreensis TaxID=1534307 RepID=A0A8T3EAN4_9TELE|nr:hypothetical protein AGOR_G00002170 [Albula goreensis]